MPSDHFGSALAAGLILFDANKRAGALGIAHASALGLALVDTGEHYVVDLLAGGSLALGIHLATSRLDASGPQPRPRILASRASTERAKSSARLRSFNAIWRIPSTRVRTGPVLSRAERS